MARPLDFIIIGAQKAGTTSLWQYLRAHPRICMPRAKEVPLFVKEPLGRDEVEARMARHFFDASADALRGKTTPGYMTGLSDVSVELVVERMASALPDVRLIAILRDPIERAVSNYMMEVRRGSEDREIDVALTELLAPEALARSRQGSAPVDSYVTSGEYGRMLSAYRSRFPEEQLLVVFTEGLARDPGSVLDSVLDFLGLPIGFRPERLGVRHFPGGTRRLLDKRAADLLFEFYEKDVVPYLEGNPDRHMSAFAMFFETWNVVPEGPPELAAETRSRLEAHFRRDAETLAALGIAVPWIARWDDAQAGSRASSST